MRFLGYRQIVFKSFIASLSEHGWYRLSFVMTYIMSERTIFARFFLRRLFIALRRSALKRPAPFLPNSLEPFLIILAVLFR